VEKGDEDGDGADEADENSPQRGQRERMSAEAAGASCSYLFPNIVIKP